MLTVLSKKGPFLKIFYLLIFRQRGREKDRERNINVWLSLCDPPLQTWPATQACALTRNQTGDPLVCRPVLNPLSHTSLVKGSTFNDKVNYSSEKVVDHI